MTQIDKDFTFYVGDKLYMKLVTELTAYWRGSIFTHADGLLHFYRESLSMLGDELKYYETESMAGAKPLKADTLNLLPHWLTNPKARRGIYLLSLESGSRPNEPSDRAFFFLADEEEETRTGVIRLVLPASFMDGGAQHTIPLVSRLLDKLEFESGHAGFSVNWDSRGEGEDETAQQMAIIAKKYPGVDLNFFNSTVIAFQNSTAPSIKCVNWLTFVGNGIRKNLPEIPQLREALGEGCDIHELPTGLILQAGPVPELGLPTRRQYLDPYFRVGGLLADFRLRGHPQIIPDSTPGEDATEEWLARFD